ncbi:hypothetical protein LTR05_005983 [Lithohypha guttulata]|uniref:Uncharacterized protein n=1 Tax=Lithohypha guttulata TaxID=1690604 RepID=A0AAN7SWE9_9EURO|nr:hypothetical protein LTR05_005983 [Lithohypha guttulata]
MFSYFFVTDPLTPPGRDAPLAEEVKKLDIPGTLVIGPYVICLLLGLQWGGIRYGWSDVRIIVLLVVFAILALGFGILQYRLGERAMVPPNIAKKRSTMAAMWFAACCSGTLAITEYYTSIYWQGVRGDTPTVAGLLSLGLIVGLSLGCIVSGFGINIVGYYTPFMITTSILAPIASGLLTTIDLDESKTKVVAILAMLGFGVGLGLGVPFQAMAAILSPQEVSLGIAMVGFAGGLASALFISASATLFQNRLEDEISKVVPGIDSTALSHAGLSDIRGLVGQQNLKDVLTGYNRATVETLYMPLALSLLTVVGSATMEWVSVKKKRD